MYRYIKSSISDKIDGYRTKYMINGWEYSKSYVKSLGISNSDIEEMLTGTILERNGDKFYILFEDEYGHDFPADEVNTY